MFARRLLVLMLVVAVFALVAGCGGQQAMEEPTTEVETTPPPPPPPVEEPVTEEPAEPRDVDMKPVLNDVFFAFDKHSLTAEAKATLEDNAEELQEKSNARIVIEGHCDERGTKSYNLALGEKRANAARDYLVALGINQSRITTISYGKERPFAMGHNEAAWAKNRRAHFVIK